MSQRDAPRRAGSVRAAGGVAGPIRRGPSGPDLVGRSGGGGSGWLQAGRHDRRDRDPVRAAAERSRTVRRPSWGAPRPDPVDRCAARSPRRLRGRAARGRERRGSQDRQAARAGSDEGGWVVAAAVRSPAGEPGACRVRRGCRSRGPRSSAALPAGWTCSALAVTDRESPRADDTTGLRRLAALPQRWLESSGDPKDRGRRWTRPSRRCAPCAVTIVDPWEPGRGLARSRFAVSSSSRAPGRTHRPGKQR